MTGATYQSVLERCPVAGPQGKRQAIETQRDIVQERTTLRPTWHLDSLPEMCRAM
ncbi:hypothetical protein TRAPUB_1733 [Trametes pubescens]|uniref:Uncharacterized protein n=1 Tax=Trametes pubescens TaxID=154538 RepID=A0A1M2VIQ8_TRAPU|nr:hypothetical protein TRAPUB_1733 [Trametes pubescens]